MRPSRPILGPGGGVWRWGGWSTCESEVYILVLAFAFATSQNEGSVNQIYTDCWGIGLLGNVEFHNRIRP